MAGSIVRQEHSTHRRRLLWGLTLACLMLIAGATLLTMALIAVTRTRDSGWQPNSKQMAQARPVFNDQASATPSPVPEHQIANLPTPLPYSMLSSVAELSQANQQGSTAEPVAADGSTRLIIEAIGLDAPIRPVGLDELEEDGQRFRQWQVPADYAVGWHRTSARPGLPGNTVLNGHNNVHGAVFRDLVDVAVGDEIVIYHDQQPLRYQVARRNLLEENDQPLRVRLDNANWMLPTADERLTLISCWPYVGNTHRVIVVAVPVGEG